jgi:hypothetical protein
MEWHVNDEVRVSAWVTITNLSRFRCSLNGDRDFEIACGDDIGGFEFLIERGALARLVALAGEALARPLPADSDEELPELISVP